MKEEEALQILGKVGAVITKSHIVYTSGRHGRDYINKDAVYPRTAEISRLCRAIAERFVNDNVQVVIAPAVGGCILSNRVAEHLSDLTGREVLGVYADKEGDGFVIRRGYDKLIADRRVLVVEDVLTTGGSARKVVEVARAARGKVVGLGALCNRGGITSEDVADVPRLEVLVNVKMDSWTEEECEQDGPCSRGEPINTDVGKGREFLEKKKK